MAKCTTCDDTGMAVYPLRLCGDCDAGKENPKTEPKVHRRVTFGPIAGTSVALPSKAMCGSGGKRTSSDDEVTCGACRKLMTTRRKKQGKGK